MAKITVTNAGDSGTSNVSVASGATLGGSGAVSGNVTVDGTLSPGHSIESLGTGSVTFNSGSTFKYEIDGTNIAADLLNAMTGSLSIATSGAGVSLSLVDLMPSTTVLPGGTKFTLISYNGTWNGGTFSGAPDHGLVPIGAKQFRIRYSDKYAGGNFASETHANTNGRFVTLTAVPELGSFVTMGGIVLCSVGLVNFIKRREMPLL